MTAVTVVSDNCTLLTYLVSFSQLSWPPAGQPLVVVGFLIRRMALILVAFYVATLLSANFRFSPVNAQNISTSIPVPPLQWLNLSGLLHGSSPPPLKDAAIGYDETRYVFPLPHICP